MMRRHETLATGVAISGILLTGCAENAPDYGAPSAEYQRPLTQIDRYWASQGLGELSTKLVVIESGESYTCGEVTRRSDSENIALYCGQTDQVVLFEDSFHKRYETFTSKGGDASALISVILSHEVGHKIQKELEEPKSPVATRTETQADCIAGMTINEIAGDRFNDDAKILYKQTHEQNVHGKPQARYEAFLEGQSPLGDITHCGLDNFPE